MESKTSINLKKKRASKTLKYLCIAILATTHLSIFMINVASSEEGPVYNFNFHNPNPINNKKNKLKQKQNPTPLSTSSKTEIPKQSSIIPGKKWGPELGFFAISYAPPVEYAGKRDNDNRYDAFAVTGYSLGVKLPFTPAFSIVPQLLQVANSYDKNLLGMRLDIRGDFFITPKITFGTGLSVVSYQRTSPWTDRDPRVSGIGLFCGPSYTHGIFYIGTEARLDYVAVRNFFDQKDGFIGFGLSMNMGLRI